MKENHEGNENMDNIFLCLAQVCLCTKYLERIIRAEDAARNAIPVCIKSSIKFLIVIL